MCSSDVIKWVDDNGCLICPIDENCRFLEMLGEALHPLGIRTGHENNCGPTPFSVISKLDELRQRFPDSMQGMLVDAGHVNVYTRHGAPEGERTIDEYISRLPFEIFEVHLSDNKGDGDEHKHLGYGNLDLVGLFTALRKRGFNGHLTLEIGAHSQLFRDADTLRGVPFAQWPFEPLLRSRACVLEAWEKTAMVIRGERK